MSQRGDTGNFLVSRDRLKEVEPQPGRPGSCNIKVNDDFKQCIWCHLCCISELGGEMCSDVAALTVNEKLAGLSSLNARPSKKI